MNHKQRGNAFVMTLISVVLMGALTFVLARQMQGSAQDSLSAEKAALFADTLIAQGAAMAQVLESMQMTGTTIDDLSFVLPSSGSFETGSDIHKVFHPGGGGLRVPTTPADAMMQTGYGGTTGWQVQTGQNVEWTASSDSDVLYSFLGLADAVCEAINDKLLNDPTAITTTANYDSVFVDGDTDVDFTTTLCADCEDVMAGCVNNGSANAFYTVAAGR